MWRTLGAAAGRSRGRGRRRAWIVTVSAATVIIGASTATASYPYYHPIATTSKYYEDDDGKHNEHGGATTRTPSPSLFSAMFRAAMTRVQTTATTAAAMMPSLVAMTEGEKKITATSVTASKATHEEGGAEEDDEGDPLGQSTLRRRHRDRLQSTPPPLPTRSEMLETLKASGMGDDNDPTREFDLLVIGGGATGTGVALDATTRGLKVALVERDDFSSGTSSRSTKLVHGGVRYLEKALMELDYEQYKLVREALHERATFLETAPYLSYQLPIMLPLYKWWQLPYYWVGCKAYDFLAGKEALESSYVLSKTKALEAFPMLRKDNLVGAIVYYDGAHNDSRMNVALAMTAVTHGATVANHVEVVELLKRHTPGKVEPQVCGAICMDTLTGDKFPVRCKGVINATGPFTDGIRKLDCPTAESIVAPSAGVHIILPNYYSPADMGLLDPRTSDGRVIFFLPWQGGTIAGTTDAATTVDRAPRATEEEISWILSEVSRYLSPDVKVRRSDVLAAWSGIRPLVRDPSASSTAGLVRNHMIHSTPSGLLTIAGGKWTTYRAMAQETVDRAIVAFQLEPVRPHCQTEHTLLVGSHGYSKTLFIRLIQNYGLEPDVAKHLADSYGDRAWAVAAYAKATGKRWPLFGKRLAGPGYPYIEAEVTYAVRREYACTAIDVLARRTRLAFLNAVAAAEAVPRVVHIMAEELGWDSARCAAEHDAALKFLETMGLPSTVEARNKTLEGGLGTQPYFTSADVERFRSAFVRYDSDGDGSIAQSKLPALVKELRLVGVPKHRHPSDDDSFFSGILGLFKTDSPPSPSHRHPQHSSSSEHGMLNQALAACGLETKRALEFNEFLDVVIALQELHNVDSGTFYGGGGSEHPDVHPLPALSTERSGGGV